MKRILLATVALIGLSGVAMAGVTVDRFPIPKELFRIHVIEAIVTAIYADKKPVKVSGNQVSSMGVLTKDGFVKIEQKVKGDGTYYCLMSPNLDAIRCTDSYSAYVSTYARDANTGNAWTVTWETDDSNSVLEEKDWKAKHEYVGEEE